MNKFLIVMMFVVAFGYSSANAQPPVGGVDVDVKVPGVDVDVNTDGRPGRDNDGRNRRPDRDPPIPTPTPTPDRDRDRDRDWDHDRNDRDRDRDGRNRDNDRDRHRDGHNWDRDDDRYDRDWNRDWRRGGNWHYHQRQPVVVYAVVERPRRNAIGVRTALVYLPRGRMQVYYDAGLTRPANSNLRLVGYSRGNAIFRFVVDRRQFLYARDVGTQRVYRIVVR